MPLWSVFNLRSRVTASLVETHVLGKSQSRGDLQGCPSKRSSSYNYFSISYPKFMVLEVSQFIPSHQARLVVGIVTAERVHTLFVPEAPAVCRVCATH